MKRRRRSRWRGWLLALCAGGAIALFGFSGFVHQIRARTAVEAAPRADAIVVLTGGSRARLETGVRLLEAQAGARLLISGVNPAVEDAALFELLAVDEGLAACCVDLGRNAEDTLGNAAETAAWAQRHSYQTLIIVTDDYHMPRSLAELRIALPETTLIAHPVATTVMEPAGWLDHPARFSRLWVEYGKYLVVRARETLIALFGGARAPAAATAQAEDSGEPN